MNNMIKKMPLFMLVIACAFVNVAHAETMWVKAQNGCKIWWEFGNNNLKNFKAMRWSGSCKKGYASGKGVAIYQQLDRTQYIYQGEFKKGKADGYGKFRWPSGKQYTGMWKNNNIDGTGVMTWPNGKKYVGSFAKNVYYTGVVTFANGSTLDYIKGSADVTGNAMKLMEATNKAYSDFLLMRRMHVD